MKRVILMTMGLFALVLVYSSHAHAAPVDLNRTAAAIDAAVADGGLSYEQGLVAKVQAMAGVPIDPDLSVRSIEQARPQCGTPIIIEVISAWDDLSPWAREQISAALDFGDGSDDGAPILPDKARSPRPGNDTPNSYQSEHFNIKWGSVSPPSADQVEDLADALETSWDVEVEAENYPAPTNSSSYFVDVYIGNTGADGENVPGIDFSGAYTSIYTDGNYLEEPYMSYIVIHPDILEYLGAIQEISAHEFFHVLQFAIWIIHYPQAYMDDVSQWWWEATAVWMEDVVYDDINAYIYFLEYYMQNPEESLHEYSYMSSKMYAMVIWAKYLSENHGGNGAINELWTNPDPAGILVATDTYLTDQSEMDLKAGVNDFLARVAMADFDEASQWADIAITETVAEYPYTQDDEYLDKQDRPRIIGTNFYRLRPGTESGTLVIEFNGQDDYNGKDIDWNLMALGANSGKGYDVFEFATDDEDEAGTLEIPGFGTTYDEVWFAVSPYPGKVRLTDDFGTTKSFTYSWQATISEGGDDDDDSGGGDDDDNSGCCG